MFSPISSKLVLIAMMKILSLPVLAQTLGSLNSTGITMSEISYGGTACPQGSLSFVYTISDTRFDFILSQFFRSLMNVQGSCCLQWIYGFNWVGYFSS
jgi:hypothetical protein